LDDITITLQDAAAPMQASAEALDEAQGQLHILQGKHDATVKKIAETLKQQESAPQNRASATLAALIVKQTAQLRTLTKQQALTDRARRTYETHHKSFERLGALYTDRLQQARYLRHRQDRRERALIRTFERLIQQIYAKQVQRDDGFELPQDSHSYIALDAARFLDMLMDLDGFLTGDPDYAVASGRYRPVSFLEVGCGQGRNMVLAQNARVLMIERIRGFDIDSGMVAGGREAFGFGHDIYVADALEVDYGGHDVIYAFRPFSNMEVQARLEERISSTMSVGAYYLGALSYDMARYPEMRRMGPEVEIWKKTAQTGAL
jgi:SAM-dependent methyltransferase